MHIGVWSIDSWNQMFFFRHLQVQLSLQDQGAFASSYSWSKAQSPPAGSTFAACSQLEQSESLLCTWAGWSLHAPRCRGSPRAQRIAICWVVRGGKWSRKLESKKPFHCPGNRVINYMELETFRSLGEFWCSPPFYDANTRKYPSNALKNLERPLHPE